MKGFHRKSASPICDSSSPLSKTSQNPLSLSLSPSLCISKMQNLFRSLLRTASSSSPLSRIPNPSNSRIPTRPIPIPSKPISSPSPSFCFYSSKSSSSASKSKAKSKSKSKSAKDSPAKASGEPFSSGPAASAWTQEDLAVSDSEDISGVLDSSAFQADRSLDVGPNGRPLFTSAKSLSDLGRKDVPVYMDFRLEGLSGILGEGLVSGLKREFKLTQRCALLVRQSFLDLRDNFRRVVDPPLRADGKGPKVRKQIVLDGPVSCGKSITLAMLVHWARSEGWLVLYVPQAREWTHGGFFYKHPETGLWDTPLQAAKILQDFLKCNESHLQQLPCQNYDPIPLGEGAGVGWMKGVDSMAMPEGSTLFDLIQTGLTYTHAAVGVVVRLRQELSMVKDVPVLIAIDQYNSWFTFSGYEEPVTPRSCRPIHAREISTVNAFRSMMQDDMMVGAFSHSTAVGKLRKDLPNVPLDARINLPRYTLDEAATVCHYYLRQGLVNRDKFSEERWKKIYYLSNGNGSEMRFLVPFI